MDDFKKTASEWGNWFVAKAEVAGQEIEVAAEKAAKAANEKANAVSGLNKRIVVSYLSGLVQGHWEGETGTISETFVFSERDGFEGGKEFILQEINRRDRTSEGDVEVWDCGASFPFKTKATITYPKHTDLELSLKRFEVTTYGVVKVFDGQIVSHEQRSDFFKPVPLPTVAL